MSPHQIKNPVFDSVHSVRKGAHPGAKVLLRKSHDEGDEKMETATIMKAFRDGNFHKAMHDTIELRKAHKISAATYNEIFRYAAVTAYPLAKSEAEAVAQYQRTPGGARMLNQGLEADFVDMMQDTARANASLVAKSKKPRAEHASNEAVAVDGDESDADPDDQLRKLGEAYRLAHPAAKFTREAAIAHVMQHDEDGRRLAAQSKRKNISRYGEKYATYFDKAQSAAARTVPPSQPDVRRDPANRAELDRGQTAVDAGHAEGRDFAAKVKELMNREQISYDEAVARLYREERLAKLGW
jgi:hypothetical protein